MDDRTKTSQFDLRGHNGHSTLPRVVDSVKKADDKLVTFVRERPLAAVCAAVAVGYLFGRLLTRLD